MKVYWPYIIGNDSPIPNLFEHIGSKFEGDKFDITVLKNNRDDVLSHENVDEQYAYPSDSLARRLRYLQTALKKYDLLHTGGRPQTHYQVARLTELRNRDIKHIHTFRVDIDPEASFGDIEIRQKLAEMADTVTAVSEHTARIVADRFDVEPRVIYNGVDPEQFQPDYKQPQLFEEISDGVPIFIYVGSFSKRKRPSDIIEIARQVKDSMFVMIGDGDEYSKSKKQATELDNLHLTGRLRKRQLPPIYANATGLIFPSIREGCPNVVLESLAAGTPVIGYEATSMPELITHKKTGFLTTSKNVSGLIEGVRLLMEKNTATRYGKAARNYILENHTFDKIAAQYESVYQLTAN